MRKLGLPKKLTGTTGGAGTNILRRVYTGAARPIVEYTTTSWATASNANKCKLDKVGNIALRAIVGAMKTTPIKKTEKRADLKPWNSEEYLQFSSRRRRSGDCLVIRSTKSWLLQPKINRKDRASTIWPGTSAEHMKIFCIHRSMTKTSSVVETGTREIPEPPSSWRYLACFLLNNRYQHNRWP